MTISGVALIHPFVYLGAITAGCIIILLYGRWIDRL